jgi:hypothetical protein
MLFHKAKEGILVLLYTFYVSRLCQQAAQIHFYIVTLYMYMNRYILDPCQSGQNVISENILKKPQLILFLQNDDDYAASDSSRCER